MNTNRTKRKNAFIILPKQMKILFWWKKNLHQQTYSKCFIKELLYSIMAKQILIKELLISHNLVFLPRLLFSSSFYILECMHESFAKTSEPTVFRIQVRWSEMEGKAQLDRKTVLGKRHLYQVKKLQKCDKFDVFPLCLSIPTPFFLALFYRIKFNLRFRIIAYQF